MSGLDSIALAVAHLEQLKEQNSLIKSEPVNEKLTADEMNPSRERASPSPTIAISTQSPPLPQSFVSHQTSRVVSSDSITSCINAVEDETDSASGPSPQPIIKNEAISGKSKNNLALILADPQAWLQAVGNLTIPKAPEGIVEKVEENDVLCGRGGESNHHSGNQQYRKLVKAFQPLYIASKRRYKPRIAQCIVYTIRSYGGRFLKRTNPRSSHFEDVGNTKAREKTSQALREGAPELRGSNPSTMDDDGVEEERASPSTPPAPTMIAPQLPVTLPQHFINHQFLQAQLGSFNGGFGQGFHPAFGTLTPLQQALLMANSSAPSTAILAKPNPQASASLFQLAATAAGQKRPANIISSSEETSSTSSFGSSTSVPRGPRLKRLKQRLSQENTDDEASNQS